MENQDTTPEEQRVLDMVADRKSPEYAQEHRELILTQAEMVGELKPGDRSTSPTASEKHD